MDTGKHFRKKTKCLHLPRTLPWRTVLSTDDASQGRHFGVDPGFRDQLLLAAVIRQTDSVVEADVGAPLSGVGPIGHVPLIPENRPDIFCCDGATFKGLC